MAQIIEVEKAVEILLRNFKQGFNLTKVVHEMRGIKKERKWYTYYDAHGYQIGTEFTDTPMRIGDRHRGTGSIVAKIEEK